MKRLPFFVEKCIKRVAFFCKQRYNIGMSLFYNYYPERPTSVENARKYPAKASMYIIIIFALLIMVGVTAFFFSWLGSWAWLFMWPWLIILDIISDLL